MIKKISTVMLLIVMSFSINSYNIITYASNTEDNKQTNNISKEDYVNKILIKYYKLFEKLYTLSHLAHNNEIDSVMLGFLYKNYDKTNSVLTSYDMFRDKETFNSYIQYKKDFFTLAKEIKNVNDYKVKISKLKEIASYYLNEKRKIKGVKKDFLPEHLLNDSEFNYLMGGIFQNKGGQYFYKKIKETAEKIDEDPLLAFTGVFTDQIRGIMTQRGYMKDIAKKYAPMLFTFSQFSYGKGGIKSFTGAKIYDDAKKYGYKDKVLKDFVRPTISDWNNDDKVQAYEQAWKKILTNKDNEAIFPTLLIKNIKTRWRNAGFPIDDKIGIIITLYNFGDSENKKPHDNPQIGGSVVVLNGNEYAFGALGKGFYWYFKIYREKELNSF